MKVKVWKQASRQDKIHKKRKDTIIGNIQVGKITRVTNFFQDRSKIKALAETALY